MSVARKEFIETSQYLEKQSRNASFKKNKIPHDFQQCVYRNAIFQCSAGIEEFIKSLLEDWIHLLHKNDKTVTSIPSSLSLWALGKQQKRAFQDYIAFGDEGKLIDSLSKSKKLPKFFLDSTPVKDVIHQTEHVRDRKYPSKKNLSLLFQRFGIKNIFNEINKKGKKDYRPILESFSDVRTTIAHTHPTPDITYADVKRHLSSINELIQMIDRVVYSHVVHVSGAECWKTSRV